MNYIVFLANTCSNINLENNSIFLLLGRSVSEHNHTKTASRLLSDLCDDNLKLIEMTRKYTCINVYGDNREYTIKFTTGIYQL